MTLLIVGLVTVIISAFAYRVGGMSKEEAKKKIPWFPSFLVIGRFRDIVCTLTSLTYVNLILPDVNWWKYLISGICMFFAMTTYWDDWFFNWMKPKDNFFLHGFFIGLSFAFISFSWLMLFRSILLSLLMGGLNIVSNNVDVEEYGRGGLIQSTLPVLAI